MHDVLTGHIDVMKDIERNIRISVQQPRRVHNLLQFKLLEVDLAGEFKRKLIKHGHQYETKVAVPGVVVLQRIGVLLF